MAYHHKEILAYHHLPTQDLDKETPDPEVCTEASGKGYFVTAVDGPKFWSLAGPYDLHADALARVDQVREICVKNHPMSHFYKFGTAKIATRRPGSVTAAGLLDQTDLFGSPIK